MNPTCKERATPNWLDLPRDIMLHIFLKLDIIDLLVNAQAVCSSWRQAAHDPVFYRRIDLRNPLEMHFSEKYENLCRRSGRTPSTRSKYVLKRLSRSACESIVEMATRVIQRSCGQLVDFSIIYFGNNEILDRIAESSCQLQRLHLDDCPRITNQGLVKFVERMSALEELELSLCSFRPRTIEAVGRCCPNLKSFRLNYKSWLVTRKGESNGEAVAIANNMPSLRSLQMFGNKMDNDGLEMILDKCPHLEYLDLRECVNVFACMQKCKGIRRLRRPFEYDDEDCEFEHDMISGDLYA